MASGGRSDASRLFLVLIWPLSDYVATAENDWQPSVCELVPLPGHQTSFQIDAMEQCRWHFDHRYPRPFFFPLNGPAGVSLTRMGHPGAENHDHHRSVWFASADVDGVDSWSENRGTQIRQKHWYRYRRGDDEAIMATKLGWYDADCFAAGYRLTRQNSLRLRYLLLVHDGGYDSVFAGQTHQAFVDRPAMQIRKSTKQEPHQQYEVERITIARDASHSLAP